jgi:hypothetical protein
MPAGVGHRFRIHVAQSEDVAMKSDFSSPTHLPIDPEFDDLLHPAQAFEHPRDVVHDPDLTLNEKRAILASWASDLCAVEAVPALRRPPRSQQVVTVDEILDALRALDKLAQTGLPQAAWVRRQVRCEALSEFRRRRIRDPGSGSDLGR